MKYYLFKDYPENSEALFSTLQKAKEFVNEFKYFVETETDFDFDDNEYTIREMELDPDFDDWYNSF